MIAVVLQVGAAVVVAYAISYVLIEIADSLGLCYDSRREDPGPPVTFNGPERRRVRP